MSAPHHVCVTRVQHMWGVPYASDAMCCLACDTVCDTRAGPIVRECTPSCLCHTTCAAYVWGGLSFVQVRPRGVQGGAISVSDGFVNISATTFSSNIAVRRSCLAIVLQCPVLRSTDAMCCLACDTVCDTVADPKGMSGGAIHAIRGVQGTRCSVSISATTFSSNTAVRRSMLC